MHLNISTSPLILHNVLHVPKLQYNLLDVQKLCKDHNCTVKLDDSSVSIKDKAIGKTLRKVLVTTTSIQSHLSLINLLPLL